MSTDRVDFTRGAAERIARVVRIVEQGDREETPLRFGRVETHATKRSRVEIVTFSGAWNKGEEKLCTLLADTKTVVATNLFFDVGIGCTARHAAVSFVRGTWFMLNAEC
jgi:hypothetical protein